MNKDAFIKFAVEHSDKDTLECLITNMAKKMPVVKDQLWKIYSDIDSGFVVKNGEQILLHPKFKKNGKDKL